jgi:RNA-directed DNA polymerase
MEPRQIKATFANLSGPVDVARLLETNWPTLRHILYRMPDGRKYASFSIKKRSGAERTINAPTPELKAIQRRLADLLTVVYEPRISTHGFAPKRSILTNAKAHVRSSFLLNIDLSDFFPSIHIGRVKGLFKKRPFCCKPSIATILAQICCCGSKLPQGAPTSPIISNLICAKMDVDLQRLARDSGCRYTRYADDMTFSTRKSGFPERIAHFGKDGEIHLGNDLEAVIHRNSFKLNLAKTRFSTSKQRQIVTGLKVNCFPNVPRSLLKQIRAMIHAREIYGLEKAELEFHAKFVRKHRAPSRGKPSFAQTLKGRLEFVGMIRGRNSPIFIKLARKLRELEPNLVSNWDLQSVDERMNGAVCVIETTGGDVPVSEWGQGTGFNLKGVGVVSCAHVYNEKAKTFFASTFDRRAVNIIGKNDISDVAILQTDLPFSTALEADYRELSQGESVVVWGSPKYDHDSTIHRTRVEIVANRKHLGFPRIVVNAPIIEGNSGGPVIDSNGKVVGIAATGQSAIDGDNQVINGFIPISSLDTIT